MDLKTAKLYSQLPSYKRLIDKTNQFIISSLGKVETPYLSCSFGKDSAVMLDLVLNHLPSVKVVFVRRIETDLVDNYQDVISQWQSKKALNLETISYKGWAENGEGQSVGIANATKILEHHDSYFVGLRADESVERRITLKTHGDYYLNKQGKTRICPVAWWNTKDIATYILTNDLPTLNTYKEFGFDERTTAAIPSKFPRESLANIKARDIQAYNQILQLLPDLKHFT